MGLGDMIEGIRDWFDDRRSDKIYALSNKVSSIINRFIDEKYGKETFSSLKLEAKWSDGFIVIGAAFKECELDYNFSDVVKLIMKVNKNYDAMLTYSTGRSYYSNTIPMDYKDLYIRPIMRPRIQAKKIKATEEQIQDACVRAEQLALVCMQLKKDGVYDEIQRIKENGYRLTNAETNRQCDSYRLSQALDQLRY